MYVQYRSLYLILTRTQLTVYGTVYSIQAAAKTLLTDEVFTIFVFLKCTFKPIFLSTMCTVCTFLEVVQIYAVFTVNSAYANYGDKEFTLTRNFIHVHCNTLPYTKKKCTNNEAKQKNNYTGLHVCEIFLTDRNRN